MNAALGGAVELLERALGYTRVALAEVDPDPYGDRWRAPTPCRGWDLARLLAHLGDALDAFTEAASGHVSLGGPAPAPPGHPLDVLRDKTGLLLGAWAAAGPDGAPGDPGDPGAPGAPGRPIRVGDAHLQGPLLVATAALEITVHGWDVAQATGSGHRIPDDLARELLDIAHVAVERADRGVRFDRPRPAAGGAAYDERLLAFLGRDLTGPPGWNSREADARPGLAS